MRHLFAPGNIASLQEFVGTGSLLGFDYDGTLAPIVADRERAGMRARTQQLFARVCELYPCAVISGRSRADVASRLGQAKVKYISGNHGLEPGGQLPTFEREMSEVRVLLEQRLLAVEGVEIEDKRYSLAVHYREARSKDSARTAIQRAVEALPVRIVAGKQVVNLVPVSSAHKGDALIHLRATEQTTSAFFIGDDVTDEDVFSLADAERIFSVRVGQSRKSAARYYVQDQHEVDHLLDKLIEFRSAPSAIVG